MPESKLVVLTPVDGGSGPVDPGYGQWPPADGGRPLYPSQGLPPGGNVGTPDRPVQLPTPPAGTPPTTVWPGVPIHKPAPGQPPITLPPGSVYPPLPPAVGNAPVIVLVWIPNVGYRWVVIDQVAATPTSTKP